MNVFSTERLEEFFLPLERRVKPFFLLGWTFGNYAGRKLRRKMSNCDSLKVFVFFLFFPCFS